MNSKKNETDKEPIRLTVDDLRRKQSVRATFRLPQHVIELLSVIAGQLGIKQKSLFDQLIEDSSILGQVAREAQGYSGEKKDRHQKTFVISRSSLLSLNDIAKKQKIPRDLLVEISIKRLLPIIETELAKHKKRKALLVEMKRYQQQGQELLKKAENQLGEDDQLYEMINNQLELAQKNISAVDTIVERGMPMEEWKNSFIIL